MKKLFIAAATLAIAVISICASMTVSALTEGDWEYKILNNEVTITNYTGSGGDVVIPDTIRGCPVTRIEARQGSLGLQEYFDKCTSLKLPSQLKEIGKRAFRNCGVKTLIFPNTLELIGESAFEGSHIEEIDLYATNAKIMERAFANSKVKKVLLPQAIVMIPDNCFTSCKDLQTVIITDTVTEIGTSAFAECSSLQNTKLPTSLKKLGGSVFFDCDSFTEIVVPFGVGSIGERCFALCDKLESVYIPDTVIEIGKQYYYNSGITVRSDNAIVYCAPGSAAEEHCKETGISYITTDSMKSPTSTVSKEIVLVIDHNYITVNGTASQMDVSAQIVEGRTLVPLRAIFEALGATVEWNSETSTVYVTRNGKNINLTVGDNKIYVDGVAKELDVPAQIISDRTMVPARAVAEAFGCNVMWDAATRTVTITE